MMKNKYVWTILTCLFIALLSSCESKDTVEVKVGSFNIWLNTAGGGLPVSQTVKVINESGADIVGLQEASLFESDGVIHDHVEEIAAQLGFNLFDQKDGRCILSRYPIVDSLASRYAVKVEIEKGVYCWMFNCHLYYIPYQPYQLNNLAYGDYPFISTEDEAIEFAKNTRQEEVDLYKKDIEACMKDGYPVFLTGDFNEPSCLDWTQRAADAGLHKIKVNWPATRSFLDAGLKDSYRVIYPDEVAQPGFTWTPVPQKDEVFDRLDFVLYAGCEVLGSVIIGESKTTSDIVVDPYPSDHRMVTSQFRVVK